MFSHLSFPFFFFLTLSFPPWTISSPLPQTPPPKTPIPTTSSIPAILTTTIITPNTTSNATDTTSSFRTLLYLPPPTTTTNLTDRGILPERLLNTCRSPTATFRSSRCLHNPNVSGSLQRYIVYCQEPTGSAAGQPWYAQPMSGIDNLGSEPNGNRNSHTHRPPLLGEQGMCASEEVCMDGWVGGSSLGGQDGAGQFDAVAVARCISKDAFSSMESLNMDDDFEGAEEAWEPEPSEDEDMEKISGDGSGHKGGEKRRKIDGGFSGRMASLVVSGPDGLTPMGVGELEVDAVGPPGSLEAGQNKSCEGCFQLRTKELAGDTSEVRAEAKFVSAAAAAVAGVLYVAVLSG